MIMEMYELHVLCSWISPKKIYEIYAVFPCVPGAIYKEAIYYNKKIQIMGHNGNKKFIRQDNILLVFFITGGISPFELNMVV